VIDVKFCGLTRAEDAHQGAALGAAFLGTVFAGGPRQLTAGRARAVLDAAVGCGVAKRVGVFGAQDVGAIAELAAEARLDVVQLHGASDGALVESLRQRGPWQIWRVVRVAGDMTVLPDGAATGVDGVLVDALVPGALGGTGVAVNWEALARALDRANRPPHLVLAGGLTPGNVAMACRVVSPDVVDVSSGVESAPGIKDHSKMRAFVEAVAHGGR